MATDDLELGIKLDQVITTLGAMKSNQGKIIGQVADLQSSVDELNSKNDPSTDGGSAISLKVAIAIVGGLLVGAFILVKVLV